MKPPRHAGLLAPVARVARFARAMAAWRSEHAQPAPLVEELEARLMYSADPAGAGLALAGAVVEQRVVDDGGEFIQAAPVEQRSHELLIVGAGIADSRMLLDGLASDGRDIEVLTLDPARDSMDQISAALAGRHDLSAIHILSHGESGALQLGADTLDAATLAARAGEVGRWGDALRAGGDILLYGCDVAAGDVGTAFVRQLAALTGADVAASDNITGDSSLHGDWTMEFATGRIDSAIAFTAVAEAQWHGTLEIGVNTVTQDKEHDAAVAIAPSGSFIVTWTADHDQDGNNTGIFAQRFDATGKPSGGQFQVNTATQDRQEMSTVGIAADGSFVVAWASHNQLAGDTDGWGIKAQRFAADGSKLGGEFLVNQTTAKDQWQPSIAVAADGQFVIAWTNAAGNDIYVRHYDAAGNPLRGEVLASGVNGAGNQTLPSVAIAADGSYVVAWQTDSGGTAKSVYAQRFNADDTLLGAGFKVNTYDADDQSQPSVAIGGTGAFVIAWTSAKQDSDAGGVYAQLYRADGVRIGSEFRVNTVTAKDQGDASVAMDGAGNFTIAWNSAGEDNGPSVGVYAQRYSASGAALGGAFLVNSTTAGNQAAPAAAMNGGGSLAIAWEGEGIGDKDGVFVALYNASNTPPVANPDVVNLLPGAQASSAAPGVLANDGDPDSGDTLIVSALLSPADGSVLAVTAGGVNMAGLYGTLLISADGSYVYKADAAAARALAAGQTGSDVFAYIISDNDNANASSTLTFNVTGQNDAPVAIDDAYAVDRLGRLSVAANGVLANDTDVDRSPADTLTVVSVNGSATAVGSNLTGTYGTLRVDANGALSYAPDALNLVLQALVTGNTVVDTFSYQVSDGHTVTTATIRITIQASNSAPVAADDSGPAYTLQQDSSLAVGAAAGVLRNDSDPDSNALTAQLISGPAHGTLAFSADGSFLYTPNANYFGADSFSYRASDGSLSSAAANVTLNIIHVNHAPSAADDGVAVSAYASATVSAAQGLLANDRDIDSLDHFSVTSVQYNDQIITLTPGTTASLVTDYGTLMVGSDGAFSYVADGAASARLSQAALTSDDFSYTISDGNGGTSTASLSIAITGINDAPVIGIGSGAGQTVSDQGTLQPFTGFSISDVDSPLQQLVVQVALDVAGKGTLVPTQGGNYDAASGIYTFIGTAADATAAVSALVFVPTANRVAPGQVDSTRFTITADDGIAAASDNSTTVASTSINDAPVITGTSAAQPVRDAGSVNPFAAVTIADADRPDQQLTVRIKLDDNTHGALSGASVSYDAATGVYTLTGTAADATTALRALVFTPAANRVAPGLTETTRFAISADDGMTASTDTFSSVVATSFNDAPSITGVTPGQAVDDNASLHPFATVTIADADSPAQQLTIRVTLDEPLHGTLAAASGSYDAATGVYTYTGTAADATAVLRALVFTPSANRSAPGAVEATHFNISVDDGQFVTSDSTTVALTNSINDAPVITGTASAQTVGDASSLHPFASVSIADPDAPAQQLTVQVAIDDRSHGTLSAPFGSYDAASGIYTFIGTAADASAALRALIFTPSANRVAPGLTETTRFTISAYDGQATGTDASTTVIATSVNDAPRIAGMTPDQTVFDNASLHPFSAVTIADADSPAQQLTVRVTLDDAARGTLLGAAGNYDPASGVYLYTGTAAEAGDALRALVFRPAANRVSPGSGVAMALTLTVDDGQAVASAVTGMTVMSVNDAPVLGLPAGVQSVKDTDSLAPFAGMTIADADSPAQQLTLRITLDDPAKGRLSGVAGSYDAAAGAYTLTGTAAQLNAAVQALLFTPVENRVAPGQAETVTFSVSVSDGTLAASGVLAVEALSVNDPPAALAVGARGVQDSTALAIVLAASDADGNGDGLSFLITAAPAHGALYLDAAALSPLLPGTRLAVSGNTVRVYFLPEAGWNGDTGFAYAAVDAHGLAGASAAVSVTVTPGLRNTPQPTAAAAIETAAVPAAPAAERPAEPAPAAPTSAQLASVGAVANAAAQADLAPVVQEAVVPAQMNQAPAPVAAPARSSAERASQATAAMLAVAASPEAGSAVLAADLSAAQALTEARIERASAAARSETLSRSLDEMRDSVKAAEEVEHRIVGSSVAVGTGFSVGYVIWLLRGGVLATSLLSSLPAWRFVDPLPVLARMRQGDDEDDTDDSLESLVAGNDRSDGDGVHGVHGVHQAAQPQTSGPDR